ncbi:transmembrane protein 11, mitochondrial isoform X1 [Lacerta agilis]|uniref:transmembrane protein 11, mitochondrial isoform X1 n=1 Tax=Lacerta agilis TaxID=80427 RepID=UPI0014199A6B|nr:transmembrane protein 11, mitochondrial isoform X1 [Lacerta agilis]
MGKEAHRPRQLQRRRRRREGECPLLGNICVTLAARNVFWMQNRSSVHQLTTEFVQLSWVTLSATDCYIVHEIYNGDNAQDQFEYELEQALEAQYKYIVIEPTRIGDETARWITVGNCLHKTAVLAGTACLFTPLAVPVDYSHYISLPAGVLSIACCTLYGISWQFDPCCKYQVEYNAYKLSRLPLHTLTSSTPVVLVRKDDLHRKRLHNTIALAALVYCVKKIYELYAV